VRQFCRRGFHSRRFTGSSIVSGTLLGEEGVLWKLVVYVLRGFERGRNMPDYFCLYSSGGFRVESAQK
jgi:hypothetical protein